MLSCPKLQRCNPIPGAKRNFYDEGAQGLKVYAPRASRFLEVEEAVALFGLYIHIFGKPRSRSLFRCGL